MGFFATLYSRGSTARASLRALAVALTSAQWLGVPVLDPAVVPALTNTSPFSAVETWETRYGEAAASHDLLPTDALEVDASGSPLLTWVAVRGALTSAHAPTGWIQGTKDVARALAGLQVTANDREHYDQAARRWFTQRIQRGFAQSATPPPVEPPATPPATPPVQPPATPPTVSPQGDDGSGLKALAFVALLAALAKGKRRSRWWG